MSKIITPKAYEDQLIKGLRVELNKELIRLEVKPSTKKQIMELYDDSIDYDNIKEVYTHPIMDFLYHLINGTLNELYNNTSIRMVTKQ